MLAVDTKLVATCRPSLPHDNGCETCFNSFAAKKKKNAICNTFDCSTTQFLMNEREIMISPHLEKENDHITLCCSPRSPY